MSTLIINPGEVPLKREAIGHIEKAIEVLEEFVDISPSGRMLTQDRSLYHALSLCQASVDLILDSLAKENLWTVENSL